MGIAGALGATGAAVAGSSPATASQVRPAAANSLTTIAAENALPGSPPEQWESWQNTDDIAGFTTAFSVLPGEKVRFKIKTDSANYRIRMFRLGWYQGKGARHLADVTPSANLPQSQPAPLTDASTGLVDCANWAESASWTVPAGALSGVYYALFEPLDGGQSSHTFFVVRREGPSDILVQTSEMTMHAYNRYGGNSLYYGNPSGRAYKVSYNRPFIKSEQESSFFNAEIALVRWLERNGYDVAYCGGIDAHQGSAVLQRAGTFISSGHDEYVSGPQRENVEQARDAGTNLVFMTGNEYFWRVRFEPSLDNSGTADRTMVCYKETLANAKIDPTSEWTGTWRDPRFTTAPNGSSPENLLTGTLFRAILPTSSPDLAITVPGEFASHRFWRDTPVADLSVGQSRELAPNTLGYEFDVDADNGYRPPGLIRLSATEAEVPDLLLDYGKTYSRGRCTHHITMYRASSGALVCGFGTVQWSYGLDEYHITDVGSPTDPVMQQATVNLLADLGAQPVTLQSGLTAASASDDTLAPVVIVDSPSGGTEVPIGASVTVTGTAVDSGGGVVAGVECSVDGGSTWHVATGREAWSYVFTPVETGPVEVRVRAIDDSCNIGEPSILALTGGPRTFPCSIFAEDQLPETSSVDDAGAIEVGVRFNTTVAGFVTGLRFFKGEGNTGTHVGRLWSNGGAELAQATFADETASGWQTVSVPSVPLEPGTTYVASAFLPNGRYAATAGFFQEAYDLAPLRALAHGEDGANGIYRAGSTGFPTSTFGASNYFVDIVFDTDNNESPRVIDHAPANGLQSVALNSPITVTFSEGMVVGTLAVALQDSGGSEVGTTSSYNDNTRTLTLTPDAPLEPLADHTVEVTAGEDSQGNSIEAFSWGFSTVGAAGTSPMSLWDTSAAPDSVVAETNGVELGVKFTAETDGEVTALRFHKADGSSGTHVGHLWTSGGALLATAPYTGETRKGWQQVNLDTPVATTAGEQYVVSYQAPNGVYGASSRYFANKGAGQGPLQAPSGPTVDGNGVFTYAPGAFPSSSYQNANYWADLVFAAAGDTKPPVVLNQVPAPSLIAVPTDATVSATFDGAVVQNSATSTLQDAGGQSVSGSMGYDADTSTLTFTPSSALQVAMTYTASVQASDVAGNEMTAPVVWSFTTVSADEDSPTTLWDSGVTPDVEAIKDDSALELGVRFRADRAGTISGIRFYKGEGNTGNHVGHLWTADGTLLSTVAFANETLRGWQQATLGQPVPIVAGTDYVASYHAPKGRYAVTSGGFNSARNNGSLTAPASSGSTPNGVFKYGSGGFPSGSYGATNYWVDVIFEDSAGPSVVGKSPGNQATVATTAVVTVTFDERVAEASIVMTLLDGAGSTVAGAVSYDDSTLTATFAPASPLEPGQSYTASVQQAEDLAGNGMAESVSWGFSTVGAEFETIWSADTTPQTTSADDTGPLELGVKFAVTAAGAIHGIRFYKGGPNNSGPHAASLWTTDGTQLATVQFAGESARGWQTAMLATPVQVAIGTTYVASYFAPNGRYAVNGGYFNGGAVESGQLRALANGEDGGNGVYRYTGSSAFPTASYNGGNYWVDVLFIAD